VDRRDQSVRCVKGIDGSQALRPRDGKTPRGVDETRWTEGMVNAPGGRPARADEAYKQPEELRKDRDLHSRLEHF
jgi:hypothetical protein